MPLILCLILASPPISARNAIDLFQERCTYTDAEVKFTLESFAQNFVEATLQNAPLKPFLTQPLQSIDRKTIENFLNLTVADNVYILHPLQSSSFYCVPIYFENNKGYWNEIFLLFKDTDHPKIENILDLELAKSLMGFGKLQKREIVKEPQKVSHSKPGFIGIYITLIVLFLFSLPKDRLIGLMVMAHLVLVVVEDIRVNRYHDNELISESTFSTSRDILQLRKTYWKTRLMKNIQTHNLYGQYLDTLERMAKNQPIPDEWEEEHAQGKILQEGIKFYLYEKGYFSQKGHGKYLNLNKAYNPKVKNPLYIFLPNLILRANLHEPSWEALRFYLELFPYSCDDVHAILAASTMDFQKRGDAFENIVKEYLEQCY